jgi:hypothetical protein
MNCLTLRNEVFDRCDDHVVAYAFGNSLGLDGRPFFGEDMVLNQRMVSWLKRMPPYSACDCSRGARFTSLPMIVYPRLQVTKVDIVHLARYQPIKGSERRVRSSRCP